MVWSRTAVYAFTGTLTRPKLIEPLHVARAMPRGVPAGRLGEPRGDTCGHECLRRGAADRPPGACTADRAGAELVGRARAGLRARCRASLHGTAPGAGVGPDGGAPLRPLRCGESARQRCTDRRLPAPAP